MGSMDLCKECGTQLKRTKYIRVTQKICSDCRGERMSVNKGAREIFKEMQANPTEPSEDEIWFEDSPVALSEIDYGRVTKNSTSNTSYGVSPLADMMSAPDTNKYRHKHGSATQGTRFAHKKGEV